MFEIGLTLFGIGMTLRRLYTMIRDHWFARGVLSVKDQMVDAMSQDHRLPVERLLDSIESVIEHPIDWAESKHGPRHQSSPTQGQG